jgi:hypothetical protein
VNLKKNMKKHKRSKNTQHHQNHCQSSQSTEAAAAPSKKNIRENSEILWRTLAQRERKKKRMRVHSGIGGSKKR